MIRFRNPFRAPSLADCGRDLNEWKCLSERARRIARAKQMRDDFGMGPHPYFERRGG